MGEMGASYLFLAHQFSGSAQHLSGDAEADNPKWILETCAPGSFLSTTKNHGWQDGALSNDQCSNTLGSTQEF
jgi:hypothetical protein